MSEERRDLLRQEIADMRHELKEHIEEKIPAIKALIQELGSLEEIRERRIFIEILINREKDYKKLRTAIIEKGLLLALIATLTFIGIAIYHEITEAVKLIMKSIK